MKILQSSKAKKTHNMNKNAGHEFTLNTQIYEIKYIYPRCLSAKAVIAEFYKKHKIP
jgi:hypothetical protein